MANNNRFTVEQECKCERGHRAAECGQRGWHPMPWSHEDLGAAIADQRDTARVYAGRVRIVDAHDRVVGEPIKL